MARRARSDPVRDDLVASVEIADSILEHAIGKDHEVDIADDKVSPPTVLGREDVRQRVRNGIGLIVWRLEVDERPYFRLRADGTSP